MQSGETGPVQREAGGLGGRTSEERQENELSLKS